MPRYRAPTASVTCRELPGDYSPQQLRFAWERRPNDQAAEDELLHWQVSPDIISYGTAISACAKARRWQKALSLLHGMRTSDGLSVNDFRLQPVQPNEITYGGAISACAAASRWREALALLEEMQEVDALQPNLRCFNAALSAALPTRLKFSWACTVGCAGRRRRT